MDAETLKRAVRLRLKGDTYAAIAKTLKEPLAEVSLELRVFFAAAESALTTGADLQLPWGVPPPTAAEEVRNGPRYI